MHTHTHTILWAAMHRPNRFRDSTAALNRRLQIIRSIDAITAFRWGGAAPVVRACGQAKHQRRNEAAPAERLLCCAFKSEPIRPI